MAFKELTPREWFIEIERGLDYRRRYGLEDSWSMLEALFSNVHESQVNAGPNLILSNGDTLLSGLNVPYPYISIEPRREDQVENVGIVEAIDNDLIDIMSLPDEFDPAITSTFLWGVGIFKIGYDSEFGFDPSLDIGKKNQPLGITMSQFDRKGRRIEFANVNPGMPWVSWVSPHDFVVPWGTRNLKSAEWCVHRVVRHIDDCKADPKYENTSELQPIMTAEDFMRSYNSTIKPYRLGTGASRFSINDEFRKPEYVELWEIHDRRTGKIIVIATGHQKFLRNEPDLLQVNGLPFVSFSFVPRTRSFWGTSDAHYLLQAQLELTDITLQSSKLRRANVLKMIVQEDAFDEEELTKLLSSRIAAVAKCKGGMNPRDAIAFTNPPPNNQVYQEGENVRRNSREMIGFSRNQSGEYEPGGRRTAFEVAKVAEGSDFRQNRRQGSIASAYIEIFKKINPICGRYWTAPRTVQIMDQMGVQAWKMVNGSSLKGEFLYKMAFSNEGPRNRQVDRQTASQLLSIFANDPLADPAGVRRWLIRSFNDPAMSGIYPAQVLKGQVNAPISPQMSNVQQGSGSAPQGQGSSQGG